MCVGGGRGREDGGKGGGVRRKRFGLLIIRSKVKRACCFLNIILVLA